MSSKPPIACSLTANDLPVRLDEMARLGRDALLDARRDGARAQLRFAARDGVRERLLAIVAAERECCAFLDMRVTGAGGELALTIDAPAGAEPVLDGLAAAFSGAVEA